MIHEQYITPIQVDSFCNNSINDVRISTIFINKTNIDITVMTRNNFPNTCMAISDSGLGSKVFIIRTIYEIVGSFKIQKTLNDIERLIAKDNANEELKILHRALLDARVSNYHGNNIFLVNIDRKIPAKELVDKQSIYLSDIDISLFVGRYNEDMIHPYSQLAISMNQHIVNNGNRICSGITIEIVDNENTINKRYIWLANNLIEVDIAKDSRRPSGLYVTKCENGKIITNTCSLEDMSKKYGISRTVEEAKTNGDPAILYTSKIKQLELDVNTTKHTLVMEKAEYERETIKLKQEADNREFELRRKLTEMERLRQASKDQFEERSQNRKENLELVKYVPTLLVATIAAIAYVNKK